MTETHTPLPWERQTLETEYDPGVYIVGSNLGGLVGAALPWPTEIESGDYSRVEANAAFIVHAVNSHHDLIEALRHVTACLVDELGNLADENEVADEDLAAVLGIDYARKIIAARLRIRQARAILTKEAGRG